MQIVGFPMWRLKYFLYLFMFAALISLCLIFAGLQIPRRFPVGFGRVLTGLPTRPRLERAGITRKKIITIPHLCIRPCGSKGNVNNNNTSCQTFLNSSLLWKDSVFSQGFLLDLRWKEPDSQEKRLLVYLTNVYQILWKQR